MADHTHIEWTDATWNPITGCSVASPGCANCYAMRLAGTRMQHHPSRAGLTQQSKAGPVWTGEVRFNEQWLDQPLRWKRPRKIFVCAHGDLFHESVPDEWIDRVFAVMALCPQHVFQVLTKRSARMRRYMMDFEDRPDAFGKALAAVVRTGGLARQAGIDAFVGMLWPFPNVWMGVSVEDQQRANERIPDLLATPAAVRWISAEPLLGAVDLTWIEFPNERGGTECYDALSLHLDPGESFPAGTCTGTIAWVVAGGESGHGARPMHPDWVRSLRDQCAAAGVPFHFKQWGDWASFGRLSNDDGSPASEEALWAMMNARGKLFDNAEFWTDPTDVQLVDRSMNNYANGGGVPTDAIVIGRIGKQRAGRLLDGVEHDGWPA